MKQNRPTSPARAAASRSNGAKSGGSVSASGTFRSSRNALLHSAYAPIHTLTNASTRLFNIRQLGPDETNNAGASRQIIENTHADVSGSRKPEANLRECRVRSQLTSPPRFDPSGSPQYIIFAIAPVKLLKTQGQLLRLLPHLSRQAA